MSKIGIVSGYFNPIHQGHIEYINAAKDECDYLVVIVNNDDQVKLKGSAVFMNAQHRAFIVKNLKAVDEVLISIDKDRSVAESIKSIILFYPKADIVFYNSGDRSPDTYESKEDAVCRENGASTKFLDLPKVLLIKRT